MSFYRDRVYPRLVSRLGDPSPIRARRRQLLARARGDVLEIGVGPGVNFVHYDPQRVTKLYALEPNTGMLRLAEEQRRRTDIEVEFLDLPGERIPLDDASIDTLVSTFTLCTIPGVMDAIRRIARVLKPGQVDLLRGQRVARAWRSALAAVVGADPPEDVRGSLPDPRHPVAARGGWPAGP